MSREAIGYVLKLVELQSTRLRSPWRHVQTDGPAEYCVCGIRTGENQLHSSCALRRTLDWATFWRKQITLSVVVSESVTFGTVFWVLASRHLSTIIDGYRFDALSLVSNDYLSYDAGNSRWSVISLRLSHDEPRFLQSVADLVSRLG